MSDTRLKIAFAYKVPRVTSFINEDIKLIKKLNQIFQRFERYEKEIYILEAMNVLKQLDNVFDLDSLYPVLCEYIDIRFHSTLILLFKKVTNLHKDDNIKLRELVIDED